MAHSIKNHHDRMIGDLWAHLAAVSELSDERELLRMLTMGVPSLIPCELSGIALFDENEQRWDPMVVSEGHMLTHEGLEEFRQDMGPLLHEALGQMSLLVAPGTGEARRLPSAMRKLGIEVVALARLLTPRGRMGVLFVGRQTLELLSRPETCLLLTLAEYLALRLENLRLSRSHDRFAERLQALVDERTDELRQAEERRRVLLDINNAVIANLDKLGLLQAIGQAIFQVLPFDRASLTLLDPEDDQLEVHALAGFDEPRQIFPVGTRFPRRGSHLAPVFEKKAPLLRDDLAREERVGAEDVLLREGIRSYVAVPLLGKNGKALGSLNVARLVPNAYAATDGDFLMDVGRQVALAVENMLAYKEIERLKTRLEEENRYLQEEIQTEQRYGDLVGQSPALRTVLRQIELVAPTDASVLILGESGTGKELIAREIHKRSRRSEKPLVRVNCASIPRELYESEFFGHVKGAFTGAVKERSGRFEVADGGTLFLDEVGEIPLELQTKLLRILQEQQYERVGDERTRQVDVRIIAATNRDLAKAVDEGRFRQDLFYRLNVFPIDVAPLRRRKEDIPLLAAHLLELTATKLNCSRVRLSQAHINTLQSYDWPGNVRELQNVIERAVIASRCGSLHLELPDVHHVERPSERQAFSQDETDECTVITESELRRRERDNLLAALRRTRGKIYGPGGAAEMLAIKPTTLVSRMHKMGLKNRAH